MGPSGGGADNSVDGGVYLPLCILWLSVTVSTSHPHASPGSSTWDALNFSSHVDVSVSVSVIVCGVG